MRLGLIIYGSLDTYSGGYLYDRKLVTYLREAGCEVEVVSLQWRGYVTNLLDNLSADIRNRLVGLDVDILLEDELNHPSLFLINRWLKKKKNIPIFSIVHHLRSSEQHPGWVKPLYRIVEKSFLKSVDGFIFNSQTTQNAVQQLVLMDKPAIIATPAGDGFTREMSREQVVERVQRNLPRQLMFVGNIIPRKGLHTVLAALSGLLSYDWQLNIVGRDTVEPGYSARLKSALNHSSLKSRVKFLGPLPDEALEELRHNSDILVVPSSYEGFGIVYLEAMRCGIVPIGSTSGAASEIIQNGKNGFLVDPNNSNMLKVILEDLLRKPELMRFLALAAFDRYSDFPTWEESMNRVHEFLAGQLGSK